MYRHSVIHCVYNHNGVSWITGYFWQYYAQLVVILLFILGVVTLEVIYPKMSKFKTKYHLSWKSMLHLFATLFEYRNETIILYAYAYFTCAVNTNDFYVALGLFFIIGIAPALFLINVLFVQLGIGHFDFKFRFVNVNINKRITIILMTRVKNDSIAVQVLE